MAQSQPAHPGYCFSFCFCCRFFFLFFFRRVQRLLTFVGYCYCDCCGNHIRFSCMLQPIDWHKRFKDFVTESHVRNKEPIPLACNLPKGLDRERAENMNMPPGKPRTLNMQTLHDTTNFCLKKTTQKRNDSKQFNNEFCNKIPMKIDINEVSRSGGRIMVVLVASTTYNHNIHFNKLTSECAGCERKCMRSYRPNRGLSYAGRHTNRCHKGKFRFREEKGKSKK